MKSNFIGLLFGAMLLPATFSTLRAQELEFTVTPRLEGLYTDNDGLSWGASAVYTFLEGTINDKWSYYVCNHWLADTPRDLYRNTMRASENNWLDMAYITFAPGNWEFTVGKKDLLIGSMELEYDDVDCMDPLMSVRWNSLPVFQWATDIRYCFDEDNSLVFELASSPSYRNYFDGLFLSLGWDGSIGAWSHRLTASYDTIDYYLFGFGNRFDFSDSFYATVDSYTQVSPGIDTVFESVCALKYNVSDKLCLGASLGYHTLEKGYGGASIEYKPMGGSGKMLEDLRLHVSAAHSKFYSESADHPYVFTFGITCPFSFSK